MYFIIVFSLLCASIMFYLYKVRNHNYWKKLGVPQASGTHWFFGNYKDMIFGATHFATGFRKIYQEYPDAPYVGAINFDKPYLVARDPELIKSILSTDFNCFGENEFKLDVKHDFLMGYNPFFLSGKEWKVSRSHATPLTTFAKLKHYYPNIIKVSEEMVKYIKSKYDENRSAEIETKKLSGMFTTDTVANAVFGVKNNTFKDENSFFARVTNDIFASGAIETTRLTISIMLPFLTDIIGVRFSTKKNEDILLALTRKMMAERAESKEVRNDIFQQMYTYRESDTAGVFTDKYIASHLFSFIADGYETSSDVLCFTLFELAWHQGAQDRLRNEIINMVKEAKGELILEQIEKLKYLDMVVSESLRMHPPLVVLSKTCTSDYIINGKKPLLIKKGQSIGIPTYALHRDEIYFPEPEKFDPERFTDEEIAKRHKFVYLPFGEGPRKCIGQRFGLLQVKVAIMALVQNFRILPSPKSKYPIELDPMEFISRPLNGAWVQFEALNK